MRDVAARAGVSVKTVSNFFNDYPHMRPETRARIAAAVEELDYRVNASARSLRAGRSGMIALIVPELQAYFAELAQDVIEAAAPHGLTVLVETTSGDREREIEALAGARRQRIDGAIFDPLALGPDDVEHVRTGLPLVIIGERQFDGLADHVLIADVEVARTAMTHLLETGRRRILVVGSARTTPSHTAALRTRGCDLALRDAGLELDPGLIAAAVPWTRAGGADAVTEALGSGTRFDAVLAFNDILALGAQFALFEAGLRVPEDVAVVGIDDTEDARYATPQLTSISPGRAEIARRAVDLLVDRIASPGEPFVQVTVDYELKVRRSSSSASS
ncbi:LacI family transcriptional regulator [Frondihabitans australicus]|uniref:LacI family transcriptional regulator n=2 Tax=Frondihabitans australicus TaxID=386892 RepID=A0A495IA92_9MICO|nr:LacI family transcriptional regulator [Frondihabitans australicus]